MKLRLTEKQYSLLLEYIEEARKAPEPQKLSLFFNDNPNAQFFSVIQRDKNGSESEYDFKLSETNGYKIITDINKGTKTKGCSIDANFDTMIYGTQLLLNFGKCGKLTINNVVGLKVFNDIESLKNQKHSDSIELDHDLDKTPTDKAIEYYEELKNLDGGDEVHFDSKYKYDGTVLQKSQNVLRIELIQQGKKTVPNVLTVDLSQNPFYEDNGNLVFKSKISKGEEEETDFLLPIKNFFTDLKSVKTPQQKPEEKPQQKPQQKPEDKSEQLKQDGKRAMEIILNDPNLKKAFYTQPSLWNLFVSELKGKKASGKGILPTLKIIGNYTRKDSIDNLNADFIEGQKITFKPVGVTKVPFVRNGKDDEYVFDENRNVEYHPRVIPKKFYKNFEFIGKIQSSLSYELEILDKVDKTPDTFECKVTMIVLKETTTDKYPYDGKLTIRINKNESPGYKPKETKELKK